MWPGRIDGALSRVLEERILQSIYIYTIVSCVWVKTRAICRLPVRSTARRNPGFKLARGSLRSFYERSLWKRASWARDKPVPSYEVCVHMYLHKNARNMNAYTHSRVDARIHTGKKIQTYSRMLQVCDIAYKYTHTDVGNKFACALCPSRAVPKTSVYDCTKMLIGASWCERRMPLKRYR